MRLWFEKGIWASKKARNTIQELKPEDIKSIAVIRHAALGDMILTRPFLYECRKFFPNARITLSLVSNYTRGAPDDLVDRVHIAIGSDQRGVPKTKQINVARELGYHDLIFDLAATSRSFWIVKLNRAKLKFGFPYHSLQRYLLYDIAVPRPDTRYEAEAMLDLLHTIGVKTSMPLNFALEVKAEVYERPYIVYFTSASTEYKCWPDASFIELISSLAEQYHEIDHLVLKGVGDTESVDNIMQQVSQFKNVMAVERDTVDQTIEFIAGASLVICNDTSIRHLAVAVNVPTLGLFALINDITAAPFRYWPRFGLHDIAMNVDGSWPSADDVSQLARNILENTKGVHKSP